MIKAIFFDFNGVIINDERIHLQAYREVLKTESVELSDADYFASLGMDDVAFVRAAYARAGKTVSDEVMHDVIQREYARHRELITNDLPISSGVISFIKSAARHYHLGIVSMAVRTEIDYVLQLAGLTKQFLLIVSAEPELKHKPAPDCYQRALDLLNQRLRDDRKLPLLAGECLVVEDAPPGIQAARGAGMRTVGVTTTVSEAALRDASADIVTPNLSDWNADAVHHLFD
jgi:HAD superfamily hydrolase (TIGR01509 family)